MSSDKDLIFDFLSPDEIENALQIEQEGYPSDEAGSLESFRLRQTQAGSLFLGAYRPPANGSGRKLIGFVCSTLSPDESLTHSSMSNHVPGSSSVCIHSVCIAKDQQRKGLGLRLLQEYISRVKAARKAGEPYERILLITHDNLRSFYEKAGFEWLGESSVVHGSKPWYEMRIVLNDSKAAALKDSTIMDASKIPPDVLQALLKPSVTHTPNFLSDFHHGIDDLIIKEDSEGKGSSTNKYDILCPRGCRSVILKSRSAEWVERTSVAMEPEGFPGHPLLRPLPPPPETAQWWLVTPSPMSFENIGFSRPSGTLSSGKPLKLLACAECDLGPLGWCEEGGSEFWLAASRVGYRKL